MWIWKGFSPLISHKIHSLHRGTLLHTNALGKEGRTRPQRAADKGCNPEQGGWAESRNPKSYLRSPDALISHGEASNHSKPTQHSKVNPLLWAAKPPSKALSISEGSTTHHNLQLSYHQHQSALLLPTTHRWGWMSPAEVRLINPHCCPDRLYSPVNPAGLQK